MKSKLRVLLSCLIVVCTLGTVTACLGDSNSESSSVTSEVNSQLPETSEVVGTQYTITFEGVDVASQKVQEGEKAEQPTNPAGYEGEDGYNYVFDGWFVKGTDTAYDFNAVVNGDVTLVAHYSKGTAVEYTATFVADGTTVGTVTYTVENMEVEAPAVPNKGGYTGAWEAYELAIGGVTVNAVYAAIEYTATFVAEGTTVGTVSYTVEDKELATPAVPN